MLFLILELLKGCSSSKIIAKNIELKVLCMIMALLSKYEIEDSSLQGCDFVLLCKWFTTCSFKTSVITCSVMQLYIPEDGNLRLLCCENLKTYTCGVDSQPSVLNLLSDSTYLHQSKMC
jgi:hypothetical protein